MKEKDDIKILFKNLEGSFDIHETPSGHTKRFLEKLHAQEDTSTNKNWWKPLSIAASLAVLFMLGFLYFNNNTPKADLASVSPEMEQTQHFFTTTIQKEISKLKSINAPETEAIVSDALIQIESLENEYNKLKKDLAESGNDKRVIYAMVTNFQNRIELLKQVIEKIEEIKTLKNTKDEITL